MVRTAAMRHHRQPAAAAAHKHQAPAMPTQEAKRAGTLLVTSSVVIAIVERSR